jgi:hypothetical protein
MKMLKAVTTVIEHPGLIVRSPRWGTEYYFDGEDWWRRIEHGQWEVFDPKFSLFHPGGEWVVSGHVDLPEAKHDDDWDE